MSREKMALMLMTALALPGAAGALGLGEIRIESALGEPLAAEIDIVGATDQELSGITAAIANRDNFLRYGVERPAFLATAEFKIVRNAGGGAFLAVHSRDSFTEPLVDMLVDLRWHGGETIRQYTLLLDPPGLAPAAVTPAASGAARTPASAAAASASAANAPRTIEAGAGTTLGVLARRLGAHGDADLTRTMIALFHANPDAFEGNLNRLRRGALLTVPSAGSISAIPLPDARREFRSQMQIWRGTAAPAGPAKTAAPQAPQAVAHEAAVSSEVSAGSASTPAQAPVQAAALAASAITGTPATLVHEQSAAAATAASASRSSQTWLMAAASALLLGIFAAFQLGRSRAVVLARPTDPRAPESGGIAQTEPHAVAAMLPVAGEDSLVAAQPPVTAMSSAAGAAAPSAAAPPADASSAATSSLPAVPPEFEDPAHPGRDARIEAKLAALGLLDGIDVGSLEASYFLESDGEPPGQAIPAADAAETAKLAAADGFAGGEDPNTETMPVETAHLAVPEDTVETTRLDYNLMDLDATAHHVQMPSRLHENVPFKERRTSLVDALKLAIEREPKRGDLRMKLLETYYAAAAANRKGFLDLVRKLADERDESPTEEWDKIVRMGRQIASDSELFSAEAAGDDGEDLANCA